MPRFSLILLISWVCAGCATGPAVPVREPVPRTRAVRLLESDPALARLVRRSISLVPVKLTALEEQSAPDCRRFRVESPSEPQRIVSAWKSGLLSGDGARPWLLGPLIGNALRVERDTLVVCASRPTPDWPERAQHPDLWPVRDDGPFHWNVEGNALLRSRPASRGTRRVERIDFVKALDREAAMLISTGKIDAGIVYGRTADMLLAIDNLPVRLERVPEWDKVYALWLSSSTRWLNDPRFRHWLAGAIDRDSAVRYLFAGRGEPVSRLLAGGRQRSPAPAGAPPFATSSDPRLTLTFDIEDLHASGIAARVKAALLQNGVTLEIFGRSPVDARQGLEQGRFHMALVSHHPPLDDPVLALQDTLGPLGNAAANAMRRLDRVSRISSEEARRERALLAEDSLLGDATLVPLLRLHAWLVRSHDLQKMAVGRYGVLRFDRAEWRR